MTTTGWVLLAVATLAWFDLMFLLVLGMYVDRLRHRLDVEHDDVAAAELKVLEPTNNRVGIVEEI